MTAVNQCREDIDQGAAILALYPDLAKKYSGIAAQTPENLENEKQKIVAETANLPPLQKLIRSVGLVLDAAEAREPINEFPADESGNAQALERYCGGGVFKFTAGRGLLVYDSGTGTWRADLADAVANSAGELIARHRANLKDVPPAEWSKAATFAKQTASRRGIQSTIELLKMRPTVFALDTDFDAEDDLLNCQGTTINLRTMEMRPTQPSDLFTRSTGVKPTPGATPVYNKFMEQITCGRPDLVAWLNRFFGTALTGNMDVALFPIFWGSGRNGKGTVERLVATVFGSYFAAVSASVVIDEGGKGESGPRPDLCDLDGPRLVGVPEVPAGRLAVEPVKRLTGGDRFTAARKFKDPYQFKPRCKIFMTSNARPSLGRVDEAITRRVRLIPFNFKVSADSVDPTLETRLADEAPMILAKWIDEAFAYLKAGCGPRAFPKCPTIEKASAEYLQGEDIVGTWLTERAIVGHGSERSSTLYANFKIWAEAEGIRTMSQRDFSEALIAAGFEKNRLNTGVCFMGICLKGNN